MIVYLLDILSSVLKSIKTTHGFWHAASQNHSQSQVPSLKLKVSICLLQNDVVQGQVQGQVIRVPLPQLGATNIRNLSN